VSVKIGREQGRGIRDEIELNNSSNGRWEKREVVGGGRTRGEILEEGYYRQIMPPVWGQSMLGRHLGETWNKGKGSAMFVKEDSNPP